METQLLALPVRFRPIMEAANPTIHITHPTTVSFFCIYTLRFVWDYTMLCPYRKPFRQVFSCCVSKFRLLCFWKEGKPLKSFFLPVGYAAGQALPTILTSLSCGAARPVSDLDICHICDREPGSLIPALVGDLNTDCPLFPSSFRFIAFHPRLPSLSDLSDSDSSALIGALRGKGIPLSYKTDREAVEWAFSSMLSRPESLVPLNDWVNRILAVTDSDEEARICLLSDLCDPFSAGAVFALLRYLRKTVSSGKASFFLLCLAKCSSPESELEGKTFRDAIQAMADQHLVSRPGREDFSPADACWLLSLPASLNQSDGAWRLIYMSLARILGQICSPEKTPAAGLHTLEVQGILTLQSLDKEAKPFAAFIHSTVWLLCDLFPALHTYADHPTALRSLAPNTRSGLFKRLFRQESGAIVLPETLDRIERTLKAMLSEVLSLIRFLPDPLRLPEASEPVWQEAVAACGRTVTVASEYDVSVAEAEEAGVMKIKPVHRVSLADTEDERQLRRLDEIAAQLKEETEARSRRLGAMGGCYARPALQDCLKHCSEALAAAEARAAHPSPEESTDHLALAAQARRIRLLKAAVLRCRQDLDAPLPVPESSDSASESASSLSPCASRLLTPAAVEKLSALLLAEGDSAEPIRKEIRALLPTLFCEGQLSDIKTLLKELLSTVSDDSSKDPLSGLILSVMTVSREEVASLRFLSAGSLPAIPLLPDLYPEAPLLTVSAVLPLIHDLKDLPADTVSEKRGLLACLLLRQYRRRTSAEASLSFMQLDAEASPVLRAWLTAHQADHVHLVSLASESESLPFALILPGSDLIPARHTAAHASLLPAFSAPWFDSDASAFRDPCGLLCEGDRTVMKEQLSRMLDALPDSASPAFRTFLSDFLRDLSKEKDPGVLPERLELRLKASFGLRLLPAFSSSLVREVGYYEHFLAADELASRLLDQPGFPASPCSVPDDIVFCYRDVPFARENPKTLLEGIPLPAEDYILNLLADECRTLSRASDDYHDALVRELGLLLDRYPDARQEARDAVLKLQEKAAQPIRDTVTELTWPWDPHSPSVLTILTESLGQNLAPFALQPFSNLLALFPARGGEIIGDSLLNSMCILPAAEIPPAEGEASSAQPAVQPDAILPPLDGSFALSLCRFPEGRTLFRKDMLSFERSDENSIKAVLTLEGRFPVRLQRTYAPEEILNLYSHDIPTLAVWPNLPFSPEDWKAYLIYANMPATFDMEVYSADGSSLKPEHGDSARMVSRTPSFPFCFTFSRGDSSIGSVLNLLPSPEIRKEDRVTACIDFGSVGTSVVLSAGHRRQPLRGASMVRTLINNPASSRDLLRREFLPAVPVSALLPTASRIFRNVPGAAPLPFEDGIVLMSSGLQDVLSIPSGTLYTCLKWEEEKGRSIVLCLHQIMLMTALQARSDGLESILWRFAIPDEMAKAGREKLRELFISLAQEVNEAAGFPIPDKEPLVTFAAESSALGAYFRLCASEDTRGGFMVLDIGACTADISLFLRGREQAVRTCQIPLGIHYMLLPALLRNPSILRQDLGYVQDPVFLQDLGLLEQILLGAKADSSALRHSRLALDSFIADRFAFLLPAFLYHPATGMPTYLGSLLLLHFSFLMMLSGLILLQISADPGKNDFLPEQMSLCLAGRGSMLLEGLPDQVKTGLWHCLTMFRNRRVASLSLLFSSEKKMEIPVGLSILQEITPAMPDASAIPASIAVRPEELLPQFLIRFAKEFPASAGMLFPNFFTNDFYHPFTPYGESVVTAAIEQSFTDQTALKPFDALSAWISALLDLVAN